MSETFQPQPRPQHLERKDVIQLVGDLEDSSIAAILATGATYAEIEQALKWVGGGREEPHVDSEGLTPTAEAVYDVLLADPAYTEENGH
ncbi:MAG TPA: hypothetical protein VHA35_04920 [Dongiaceae bacterium]|jgi:hypothetical protein|nr:hypothetical protein [Dongiaceae bacterium]